VISDALFAQDLVLKNLVLDNVAGEIQLRFGIEPLDSEKLQKYLLDSVTLKLQCQATLFRERNIWLDKDLAHDHCVFEIKQNPITQKYSIVNVQTEKEHIESSLDALLNKHINKLCLHLGIWQTLRKGEKYSIELFVSLKRSGIPGWVKKCLFFWSWDIVPTQKYRMHFTY
jgi:hypothetical protein